MAKFYYTKLRQMEPLPGRMFATDYYLQTPDQAAETYLHVQQVIIRVGTTAISTPDGCRVISMPLKQFKRRNGSCYSAVDIMEDLFTQMRQGKDIPSGMLGRWNRLFENTPDQLDLQPQLNDFKLAKLKLELQIQGAL